MQHVTIARGGAIMQPPNLLDKRALHMLCARLAHVCAIRVGNTSCYSYHILLCRTAELPRGMTGSLSRSINMIDMCDAMLRHP